MTKIISEEDVDIISTQDIDGKQLITELQDYCERYMLDDWRAKEILRDVVDIIERSIE